MCSFAHRSDIMDSPVAHACLQLWCKVLVNSDLKVKVRKHFHRVKNGLQRTLRIFAAAAAIICSGRCK